MADILRKTFETQTKANDADRSLIVTISTANPDRSKDVVEPAGVVLDNFLRNPVVALGHNYQGLSIAKADDVQVLDDKIVAKVLFPRQGVYPLADTSYEMAKDGFMNGWSIGFMPLEWEELSTGGRRYIKWELLEFSLVLVPDNPEAVTLLRSAGVDEKQIDKAQHYEAKANKETVEKEIEAAAKATEELEHPGGHDLPDAAKKAMDEHLEKIAQLETELKEGRVLSGANLKKVDNAISSLAAAKEALEELKTASVKEDPKDDTPPADEKVVSTQDGEVKLVPVIAALKHVDKQIGIVLRDYKKSQPTEN